MAAVENDKQNETTKALQHIPLTMDEAETKKLKDKIKKIKRREKDNMVEDSDILKERGVVLLSHIPKYFVEPQMYKFFSQFGEVTRLKLMRSKKTGSSQGYAFIEFEFKEIAKVVAETMNNYLMFERLLKCKYLEASTVKKRTFQSWNRPLFMRPHRTQAIRAHNGRSDNPEKLKKKHDKTKARREKQQEKLKALGIDYDVFDLKVNENYVPTDRRQFSKEEYHRLKMKNANEPMVDLETTNEAVALVDEDDGEIVMKVDENMRVESITKKVEGGKKKTIVKGKKAAKGMKAVKETSDVSKETNDVAKDTNTVSKSKKVSLKKGDINTKLPSNKDADTNQTTQKNHDVQTPKKVEKQGNEKAGEKATKKLQSKIADSKTNDDLKPQAKITKRKNNLNKSMSTRSMKKRKINANKTL